MNFLYDYVWGDRAEEQAYEEGLEEQKPAARENTEEITPDDCLGLATGTLARLDHQNQNWDVLDNLNPVKLAISDGDNDYETMITLFKNDNKPLLQQILNDDLQLQFDASTNSLNFLIYRGDDVSAFQFTFDDEDEERELKRLIGIKLIEASYQVGFDKLIKDKVYLAGDEDFVADTLEEGAMEEDYEEPEDWNENEIRVDFNGERQDIGGDDPLADAGWTSVLDQPVVSEASNQNIEGSKRWNRTYVSRKTETGADMGLFKHSDEGDLEYVGKVAIKDTSGNDYQPFKMMPHRQDQQMLFLDNANPNSISVMDMYRGEIVENWNCNTGALTDIAPVAKYAQTTDNKLFKAIASNGQFTIDPRTQEKVVEKFVYKSNPGFNSIATTNDGYWVVASEDNCIRLGNKVMRAKAKIPGLGHAVKSVDVNGAGTWVLATCEKYLLLFNVVLPDGSGNAFTKRMAAKNKPKPLRLCLRKSDLTKYGIRNVNFTPAKFNMGDNVEESYIITTTGQYIIKWNFDRAKKGFLKDYMISKRSGLIKQGNFRYNRQDELLVAEEQSVYSTSTRGRN